jgi:uncharacterized protein
MPPKNKIKIIIDTNLFISFLIGKRLSNLKNAIINSKVLLVLSEQNINEIKIVTARPKFQKYFQKNDVDDLIDLLHSIGRIIKISTEPNICRDPKDNFLLALAEKSKAMYLVTSDKDLLEIIEYKETQIISFQSFEKIINSL